MKISRSFKNNIEKSMKVLELKTRKFPMCLVFEWKVIDFSFGSLLLNGFSSLGLGCCKQFLYSRFDIDTRRKGKCQMRYNFSYAFRLLEDMKGINTLQVPVRFSFSGWSWETSFTEDVKYAIFMLVSHIDFSLRQEGVAQSFVRLQFE